LVSKPVMACDRCPPENPIKDEV